ncbi:hypothetical protein ABKN59_000592 [Abortiporus biennis]
MQASKFSPSQGLPRTSVRNDALCTEVSHDSRRLNYYWSRKSTTQSLSAEDALLLAYVGVTYLLASDLWYLLGFPSSAFGD